MQLYSHPLQELWGAILQCTQTRNYYIGYEKFSSGFLGLFLCVGFFKTKIELFFIIIITERVGDTGGYGGGSLKIINKKETVIGVGSIVYSCIKSCTVFDLLN